MRVDHVGFAGSSIACDRNPHDKTLGMNCLTQGGMHLIGLRTSGTICSSPTRVGLLAGGKPQRARSESVILTRCETPSHWEGVQKSEVTLVECFKDSSDSAGAVVIGHLGSEARQSKNASTRAPSGHPALTIL